MAKYNLLPPEKCKELQKFIENSLNECEKGETHNYSKLVQAFAFKNCPPQNVWNWLHLLGLSVRKLDYTVHKDLIQTLLAFDWNFPKPVLEKYKELLSRLMTADALFITPVLISATSCLWILEEEETIAHEKFSNPQYQERCQVVFDFLRHAKLLRPDIGTSLFPVILKKYPFKFQSITCFRSYLSNFFRILDDFPELRYRSLQFLLEKVCKEDQRILKLEQNSESEQSDYQRHLGILDLLVATILEQVKLLSQNTEEMAKLWAFVLNCFEQTVLKAQESRHVQFILFYLCKFEQAYARGFLERLVKISTSPSSPTVVRRNALRFAGGLVARATYIQPSNARFCLETLINWTLNYVMVFQEAHPYAEMISFDKISSHQSFYVAMQTIFFIIIHRSDVDIEERMDDHFVAEHMDDEMEEEVTTPRPEDRIREVSLAKKLKRVLQSMMAPLLYTGEEIALDFRRKIQETSLGEALPETLKVKKGIEEPRFPYSSFQLEKSKQYFVDIYKE